MTDNTEITIALDEKDYARLVKIIAQYEKNKEYKRKWLGKEGLRPNRLPHPPLKWKILT
jgi:hypothetical protein